MLHSGTFEIDTDTLLLRRFRMSDRDDMLRNWIADPAVQHEYGEPIYATPEEADALLRKWTSAYERPDFYRWAVIEKKSGMNIGQIAFCRVYDDCRTAEIEYCIGSSFWGNGYAGTALSAVIKEVFRRTDFQRLEAYHRAENLKSGRVLEKSDMHITDTVERFRRAGEEPEGEICYCIERSA
ncbi:MAG: GNAT family N-acetyltransferase [Ruminococcus sp.]|nr:GNAT family N-acetyltransferase [Ruminococcus sp.]